MPVEEAPGEEAKMCLLCAAGLDGQRLARRARVLQFLALVEHPDALPADAALSLAREVLALIQAERIERRCDPVAPPGPDIEEARRGETVMTAHADTHAPTPGALPGPSDDLLAELEGKYKDIHAHPEPSMQERRTAWVST